MWAAQYYPFDEPNAWITSGGLGTMGFGLPAAIGARWPARSGSWWMWPGTPAFR
jgi:thiamine pyrophosphate-dependent acetolactate synthase large subunit-like protein